MDPSAPKKPRLSEIFFYLGESSTTHIWLHLAPEGARADETAQMCGQVYNLMLHHGLATKSEACIVFSAAGTAVQPVCVRHVDRKEAPLELPGPDLAGTLRAFLSADRPSSEAAWTVCSPERKGAPYTVYKTPGRGMADVRSDLKEFSRAPLTMAKTIEVFTAKAAH